MNQNPHVHLRGPLGHLSLKAVTMFNFTSYSKVIWPNLTNKNRLIVTENYIYKQVNKATRIKKNPALLHIARNLTNTRY
jgi:hypothetical protein